MCNSALRKDVILLQFGKEHKFCGDCVQFSPVCFQALNLRRASDLWKLGLGGIWTNALGQRRQ
jgi:hypothetical protein